ncbi:hypothetical protein CYG48_02950 [Neorhizobium sp. SOG26]|uniref:hypothetical protein n=1 Tax=Neorhizobium sp. SOG26 TaxID=2060726 RepID=UPI000E5850C2|nr:hypothetical protein [Neorhizobium sp. SOG26]AXV14754.1 hypothetical protein CYG48_02950 [Neorhizobium sp. SOG26]
MAEIVILNKWRSEHAARKPEIRIGEDKASAQVLLFTGVRYERYGDWLNSRPENQAVGAE